MPQGCIQIRHGKSRNAKRILPMTARVHAVLKGRKPGHEAACPYVFKNEGGNRGLSVFTLEDQHSRVRKALDLRGIQYTRFGILARQGWARAGRPQ
jgi:hypothetical protein